MLPISENSLQANSTVSPIQSLSPHSIQSPNGSGDSVEETRTKAKSARSEKTPGAALTSLGSSTSGSGTSGLGSSLSSNPNNHGPSHLRSYSLENVLKDSKSLLSSASPASVSYFKNIDISGTLSHFSFCISFWFRLFHYSLKASSNCNKLTVKFIKFTSKNLECPIRI